jgi:hypothetical protein
MEKLQELRGKSYGTAPPPIVPSVNLHDELRNHLESLVGPIAGTVFDTCVTRLGHDRDTIGGEMLEPLVEMFSSNFNLSSTQLESITVKLQDLRNTPTTPAGGPPVDIYKEFKNYLVSLTGPIADSVLDGCAERLGLQKDRVESGNLESLAEMFCSNFKLTPEQLSGVMEMSTSLSRHESMAARRPAEPVKEVKVLDELRDYLVSTVGPAAEQSLKDCIKMLGYSEETLPVFAFDNLAEIFLSKFTLSTDTMNEIRNKARKLKSSALSKTGYSTIFKTPSEVKEKTGDTNITIGLLNQIHKEKK